jgi:hypothetical protein
MKTLLSEHTSNVFWKFGKCDGGDSIEVLGDCEFDLVQVKDALYFVRYVCGSDRQFTTYLQFTEKEYSINIWKLYDILVLDK